MAGSNLQRFLRRVVTKHIFASAALCVTAYILGMYTILHLNLVAFDDMVKVVDSIFKATVVIASSIWALNRYYILRVDEPQFRIDSEVKKVVFLENDSAILIFRLDLVNTGKTLVEPFEHFVEVQAVNPGPDGPELTEIYRWPNDESHPGGPIEPGSWVAINDQFCCPKDLLVVRLFVGVMAASGGGWTWHKSFDVSGDKS